MNRRLPAVLAVLAIVPFAAACGDDDESDTAVKGDKTTVNQTPPDSALTKLVVAAAGKTTERGSVRLSLELNAALGGLEVPATGRGAVDLKKQQGRFDVKVDLSTLPAIGALLSGGGKLNTNVVFDRTDFYIDSDVFRQPGDKRWIKFDAAKAGKSQGFDLGSVLRGGGQDPTKILQFLRGAGNDVKELGKEDVRGTPTTHYRTTIDLDKVLAAAPAAQRAALSGVVEQVKLASGSSTLPIDVWIADDGTVRRASQKVGQGGGTSPLTIETTVELYGFGSDPDIEIPPASQVKEIEDISGLPGLPGLGGGGAPGATP